MSYPSDIIERLRRSLQWSVTLNLLLALMLFLFVIFSTLGLTSVDLSGVFSGDGQAEISQVVPDSMTNAIARQLTMWEGKSADYAPTGEEGDLIRYGRDLIANTAAYLGPKGSVAQITNGMNCQNCHLNAGAKPWGNNYGAVASMYPLWRARSNSVEDLYKRVSDCMERSLNGSTLPENSREMQAMIRYINWLGADIPKGEKPPGTGIVQLPYLDRAADPARGKKVYDEKCAVCHGANGEGLLASDGKTYTYPPMWGPSSYNTGAGLYRLSRFAGYVKYNMPFGVDYRNPQLSDEECWDVAAYVNSQPRPAKDLKGDWPDITKKPIDHPFGPFADTFDERQHKYGPFQPIAAFYKK